MKILPFALALSLSTTAWVLPISSPVAAADAHACAVDASDAVVALPAPLNKWAQVLCTPYGQMITGHNGWAWIEPVHRALVVIPSATLDTLTLPPPFNPD